MAVIALKEVNQWLEKSKIQVESLDTELEDTQTVMVFSSLAEVYDPSTWVDVNSTPQLVRKVISLYVAGHEYSRAYSEDEGGSRYAGLLFRLAGAMVKGILSGSIPLLDVPNNKSTYDNPEVYPDDAASADFQDSEMFANPSDYPDAPKFRMGQVF